MIKQRLSKKTRNKFQETFISNKPNSSTNYNLTNSKNLLQKCTHCWCYFFASCATLYFRERFKFYDTCKKYLKHLALNYIISSLIKLTHKIAYHIKRR